MLTKILSRINRAREAYQSLAQVSLVMLAFGLMVLFSYIYFSGTERKHLRTEAYSELAHAQTRIESDMRELRMAMTFLSQSVRGVILNGGKVAEVQAHMAEAVRLAFAQSGCSSSFLGSFGYFDVFGGAYLRDMDVPLPENFAPRERPWYSAAVKEAGKPALVPPYISASLDELVLTYACQLLDNNGNQLGVIGIDVSFARISDFATGARIVDIDGGYGILVKDYEVIAHPLRDRLGWHITKFPLGAEVMKDMEAEKEFFEHHVVSHDGHEAVLFNKRLTNGWYLGVVTPRIHYYKGLRAVTSVLVSLGAALALFLSAVLLRVNAAKNKADAKARRSEEYVNLMLNATPLCCHLLDRNFNFIDCNDAGVALYGLSSKQEYMDRYFELMPEYQPDGTRSDESAKMHVAAALEYGYHRVERVHRALDGTPIPTEVTLVRVKYGDEYVIAGYTRDLREHKRMICEIEQRDKLLALGNRAAQMLLIAEGGEDVETSLLKGLELVGRHIDADRVQIWQNKAINGSLHFVHAYEWCSDIGQRNAPVPIGLCFPYSDKPKWVEMFMRGECMNGPLSKMSPEDQDFLRAYDIKTFVTIPLFIEDRFWGFFSIDDCKRERTFPEDEISFLRSVSLMMASVVSRHEQAFEISETHERTRVLLDAVPVCCHLWDSSFNTIDCNDACVKLYGLKDKQEYKDRFHELLPEYQPDGTRSDEKVKLWLAKAFEEGYYSGEGMNQMPDGTPIPMEITLVRVKHKDDYAVVCCTRDLRSYKAYLAEIEKGRDDLRLALDAAEAANRAKSIFLANMSHEIRTPMNSILGFSELATHAEAPPKIKGYLSNISESARGLLAIINDILDISKIEAGRMVLESIPFELHDIFAHCQSVISQKAMEKGIILYCYAEPSIGKKLLGDPVRLRQALLNLLSNAVKFTNVGTVKLLASVVDSGDRGVRLRFEVKDSGIGMNREQVDRIFQPFMQADDSITRKYGGTGLGLAITKNIIELMGGELMVESAVGVGSRFGFEVRFDAVKDVSDIPSHKISFGGIEMPNFKGEILVCEDNVMNRKVVSEHLAKVGITTVIAENGKEGVELVERRLQNNEKPFDLIFMDIHMPVMDGLEASSIISAMGAKTPIVAVTANIMSNEIELYKKSGMTDFLGKPFTSQELWCCLAKYMPVLSVTTLEKHTVEDVGNDKMLRSLKIDFVKSNQNTLADIKKSIDAGDIKTAHRIAHSLKGNAGQIGEEQLRNEAATLEDILSDGTKRPPQTQIDILEMELRAVLSKLAPLLAEADARGRGASSLNTEEIRELFGKLEPMLQSKNPKSLNLLDELRKIPKAKKLILQVEDFEFKQAVITLTALKKGMGIA